MQKITQNAPPCHLDSLEEDLRAAQLWEIIASHKTGAPARNERQRHILIGEDEPD